VNTPATSDTAAPPQLSAPEAQAPGPAPEAQLETFLELSAQLFCVIDFASTVVWCNTAFERTLGYGRGELVGERLEDLISPSDGGVRHAAQRRLLATGELGFTQARCRTKAGEWRWLEWTARINAARRYVYLAARDVTDRLATETALRDSEARLRAILEHSPSLIFVKDLDGRYLLVNEEWARVSGIPADQAIGKTAAQCFPAGAAVIAEHERRLIDEGSTLVSDEQVTTVDGAREFIVSRFILHDDAGVPYGIGGIATDVTERTRIEAELAARERLLDSVLKASPDMITIMDRAGRIHQVSEAQSAMLGHSRAELSGRGAFGFVHPDEFDDVASAFVRMVTGAVAHLHLRYRVRHGDGRWIVLDSRGQAVLDDVGHFAGAVVVSRDITERLHFEERLRAARGAAEHASRAKSEFLSRMSHELRTPLNSILGFAQLLQMDDLPLDQADAVEHILRAGHHLLDLIDEVLDIARIETGHLELATERVPVADIVAEAVDLTRPAAERAEVAIAVSIDPGAGLAVDADRQRLMQVLLNLLSNAVKYNRPGGRVDVTCEPGGRGLLRLAVADSGRGIRAADLDRVFEPFDRLGAEQTGIEGTGVGLALSRHLVARMGGRLDLVSVPEVGSTFFVDLPLSSGQAVSAGRVAARPGPAPTEEPSGVGALPAAAGSVSGVFRVLLVEDNLVTLDLVERILSRRPGIEVLAAMQGGIGVDLAREHRPDLILLDLQLPDLSGGDVLDRLAEDPVTAAIPVAVVAEDAPPHQVRQLLGRGVIGTLPRPLDVRALLAMVDAVRAQRGS